jgi:hypothetical protein
VSQLHARAIRRLREALGEIGPEQVAEMRKALLTFTAKKPMAKVAPAPVVDANSPAADAAVASPGVVLVYQPARKRAPARAALKSLKSLNAAAQAAKTARRPVAAAR